MDRDPRISKVKLLSRTKRNGKWPRKHYTSIENLLDLRRDGNRKWFDDLIITNDASCVKGTFLMSDDHYFKYMHGAEWFYVHAEGLISWKYTLDTPYESIWDDPKYIPGYMESHYPIVKRPSLDSSNK